MDEPTFILGRLPSFKLYAFLNTQSEIWYANFLIQSASHLGFHEQLNELNNHENHIFTNIIKSQRFDIASEKQLLL